MSRAFTDDDDDDDESHIAATELAVHVFKLSDVRIEHSLLAACMCVALMHDVAHPPKEPPAEETAEDDESVATCHELSLPSRSLDGLWESLIFDTNVKPNVLAYATTAMRFADSRVNPHIISWNRCDAIDSRVAVCVRHVEAFINALYMGVLLQCGVAARTARHRQDESLQSTGAEAQHSAIGAVRRFGLCSRSTVSINTLDALYCASLL